jgi:hypothetical protein
VLVTVLPVPVPVLCLAPSLQQPPGHRHVAVVVVGKAGQLGPGPQLDDARAHGRDLRRGGAIELAQEHAIGGGDLLARLVVTFELRRAGLGVDHAHHAGRHDAIAHRRRHALETLEDRGGLGDAGGLEDDLVGCRALRDLGDAVPEVALHVELAAHAAAGELEHVAAPEQDELGVDGDPPQLVDEHGDAAAVRRAEDAVERGRLPGAEEAGEDREGNLGAGHGRGLGVRRGLRRVA